MGPFGSLGWPGLNVLRLHISILTINGVSTDQASISFEFLFTSLKKHIVLEPRLASPRFPRILIGIRIEKTTIW